MVSPVASDRVEEIEMRGSLARRRVVIASTGSSVTSLAARRFAENGARVFLWDVDARRLSETVQGLALRGATLGGATVDLRDETSLRRAALRSIDELGGVDVLVNAFVADGEDTTLLETDLQRWRQLVGEGLTNAYAVTRTLLPTMLASGGGMVVNLAPCVELQGTGYTAMKHLAMGLTAQLRAEYSGKGVRATAIVSGDGGISNDEELIRRALAFTSEAA